MLIWLVYGLMSLEVEKCPEVSTRGIKKIAFVMPWHISERGGGAEVQANYLAQELAMREFDVYYICQTAKSERIGLIDRIDGFSIHWVKPSGKFPWWDQNKYIVVLKNIKPDLVIQRMSSNVTYIIGKYCKSQRIPFVWICTDNVCPFKDRHMRRFKERASLRTTNLVKYLIFYLSNLVMDFYRVRGMRYITQAFTQNDFQEREVKRNFNLTSNRITSGHPMPGIQISIEERFNNKIILWSGNLGKHKRPELFIQLACEMQQSDFQFVLVGGHSDEGYVEKLLNDTPPNLKIVGQVSFEESLNWFGKATLLVNTSIAEGFSNTYIQAWLRGVPTVVFGADPNDVVRGNDLGCNVRSIEEAKQFILSLLSDMGKYSDYSARVRQYARENHSIQKMTDNFLKCLEDEGIALH